MIKEMMTGKTLVLILFIIFVFAAFIFLMSSREEHRVEKPIPEEESGTTEIMSGITNVKRFSDVVNRSGQYTSNISGSSGSGRNMPISTATPIPLPYPRITINYSITTTTSIRDQIIANSTNNTYIIMTVDIRNYGYRYFDAFPTKFRIIGPSNIEYAPIVTVNTGNMLDDVIPNNSRAKGDLVFSAPQRLAGVSKIKYSGDYTILYHSGIPSEGTPTPTPTTNEE